MEIKNASKRSNPNRFFRILTRRDSKAWSTDTDGTLYDIAAITLYNDSCIGFEIGGLDMTFEVGNDTADYLNGYFE